MGAKKGRSLLKRHYVALIEDAGGVKDPGACVPYTYAHKDIFTTPPQCTYTPPTITSQEESVRVEGNVLVPPGCLQEVHGPLPTNKQC